MCCTPTGRFSPFPHLRPPRWGCLAVADRSLSVLWHRERTTDSAEECSNSYCFHYKYLCFAICIPAGAVSEVGRIFPCIRRRRDIAAKLDPAPQEPSGDIHKQFCTIHKYLNECDFNVNTKTTHLHRRWHSWYKTIIFQHFGHLAVHIHESV